MAGRFTVEAVFKAIDKITAPVTRMQNKVGKFSRGFKKGMKSVDRGLTNVIGSMKKFAIVGAVGLGVVALWLKKVITLGAEFELNMIRASAKFPGMIRKGTNEFKELSKEVRKLAATTEFTATQSSKALLTLAQAGFTAKEAVAALPIVMNLATAAQLELAEASRISVKAATALGLPFSNAEEKANSMRIATDLLTKASDSASTSIEDMFEAV